MPSMLSSCIFKRKHDDIWGVGVREDAQRHQVVGHEGRGHVAGVAVAGDARQRVLRALDDLPVRLNRQLPSRVLKPK